MSHFLLLVLLVTPLKQSPDAAPQVLRAPRGRCSVTLTVGRLSGFRILQLPNHAGIQDVNGTAWFNSSTLELARIGRDKFIYLYYAPDVDKVDFERLREPQNLYRIRLDGKGFSISPAQHK